MNDSSFGLYEKFAGFEDYVRERRTGIARIIESVVNSNGQIDLDIYQQYIKKRIDILYI